MPTATEIRVSPELAAALGDGEMPLDDLRQLVPDLALAQAWGAGHIEFGRRPYCVTGPAGKPGSALVVEDGPWEWTGPKTKGHKRFAELVAEPLPKTEKCKKYVSVPPPADRPMDDPTLRPVEIPAAEAHGLVALHARLTDAGLASA